MAHKRQKEIDLNPKQEAFCQEYYKVGRVATKAARIAGYHPTYATALMRMGPVKARIAELDGIVFKRTLVNVERVIEELSSMAFTNLTDICRLEGDTLVFIDWHELSIPAKRALKEIQIDSYSTTIEGETTTTTKIKVKLHDKLGSLEKLGKALGLYRDDKDPLTKPQRLAGQVFKGPPALKSVQGGRVVPDD